MDGKSSMKVFQWVRAQLVFVFKGRQVPQVLVKAGAEASVVASRAAINQAALAVQQGGDVGAFYVALKEQIKLAHMANAALARGGWDNMRPQDWQRVESLVAEQFDYARGFAQDIARGRYGRGGDLSSGVLSRAAQYSDAARATYENERTQAHKESGATHATRIAAATDHCPTCQAENGVKRLIDEVVAIGDSECLGNCHCVIIYDF
jgi:hypothetical protein